MRTAAALLLLTLGGCSLPVSGLVETDAGDEPVDAGTGDAGEPFDAGPFMGPMDAGPPFDAGPGQDAGTTCTSADDTCVSAMESVCNTATGLLEMRACPLGCSAGGPRCAEIVPSNVSPGLLPEVAADVTLTAAIDTSTCSGSGFSSQNQKTGGEICVLQAGEVRVPSGATVPVTGRRPLVILAAGGVFIDGVLDASATGTTPGAGGARGGTRTSRDGQGPFAGLAGENRFTYDDGGGGGGGFCGSGGDGGDGGGAEGGAGGERIAADHALRPLGGGSGGGWAPGASGGGFDNAAEGGAGGGAIQITSRVSINVSGAVMAGGGGGRGGRRIVNFDTNFGAGGGGGSGGGILLEAPTVTASGRLIATGGGGGGSSGCNGPSCEIPSNIVDAYGRPGVDGRDQLDRAAGGAGFGNRYGADGGDSGGGDQSGGRNGESLDVELGDGGGGGGGGAGCIVLRTADGAGLPNLDNVSSRNSRTFNAFTVEVD